MPLFSQATLSAFTSSAQPTNPDIESTQAVSDDDDLVEVPPNPETDVIRVLKQIEENQRALIEQQRLANEQQRLANEQQSLLLQQQKVHNAYLIRQFV